jgi:hypothetical protein
MEKVCSQTVLDFTKIKNGKDHNVKFSDGSLPKYTKHNLLNSTKWP